MLAKSSDELKQDVQFSTRNRSEDQILIFQPFTNKSSHKFSRLLHIFLRNDVVLLCNFLGPEHSTLQHPSNSKFKSQKLIDGLPSNGVKETMNKLIALLLTEETILSFPQIKS